MENQSLSLKGIGAVFNTSDITTAAAVYNLSLLFLTAQLHIKFSEIANKAAEKILSSAYVFLLGNYGKNIYRSINIYRKGKFYQ